MKRNNENYQKQKVAKANHKVALKNKTRYISDRDSLVHQMLQSDTPNWGSVRINLVNW